MKKNELIALDTNILLYGDDLGSPYHGAAKTIMEAVFCGALRACLSHQVLAEYFSVASSPRRLEHPLSISEVKDRLLFFERTRRIKKVYPKRSTLKRAIQACVEHHLHGPRIFDAIYALTLLDNGIEKLCTQNIKDFAVFKPRGLLAVPLQEARSLLA